MRPGGTMASSVGKLTAMAGIMALSAALSPAATAQSAPSPARIVVPYPPGGPVDALARLVAKEWQDKRGTAVVVENKAGASGAIGTREVARAAPDGSTLVLGTNQTHVTNAVLLKEPGYDTEKDFAPVAGLAGLQHVLVAPKTAAGRTARDLVARATAEPGKLNYGSTGLGSGSHLAMELLMARTGTRLTHVPFRGAAPMAIELVAGRLDAAFATLPSVLGQIEAGEIAALALASQQRAPQLPNLSRLAEQGFADSDADAWVAMFAPGATPAATVSRLSDELTAIMRNPAVAAAAVKLGMVVDVRDARQLGNFLVAERVKWLAVVKAAGLKPE